MSPHCYEFPEGNWPQDFRRFGWTESELFGQKTDERSMAGIYYQKQTMVHKIASQAMWQILLPQLFDYLHNEGAEHKQNLQNPMNILSAQTFRNVLSQFCEGRSPDPNFLL